MNLIPGKLYSLNYDRLLYADEDCDYPSHGESLIEKGDIVLLLSDATDLTNHYGKNEFGRVKVLSRNGAVGYIFYNKQRKLFSET